MNVPRKLSYWLKECNRVWINMSWFGKYNTVFIFHDAVFPTFPENHDTKICFYSSYIEKQIPKSFLLLPLKAISIHVHHVYISFVFAAPAHELSWHKILFSKVNWGHRFFLFHWVYYIKFILTRICIHKHQIFSGLDKSNVLNIFI